VNQATHDPLDAYVERLSLAPEQRAAMLEAAALPGAEQRFAGIHRSLGSPFEGQAASVGSVDVRLRRLPPPPRRGDADIDTALGKDARGYTRLVTTPALARASMTPLPWDTHLLERLLRNLRARRFGLRGRMASRHTEPYAEPASAPESRVPWRGSAIRRRLVLLAFIIGQTWLATYFMTAILPYHGSHWLEMLILAIYAVLFAWVGAGFWTALMGFWVLVLGRDRHSISARATPHAEIADEARTAILVPICNEDVTRVFAGIRATYDSLARTGERDHFDFYILSDTSEADTRVAELEAWLQLCREVRGFGHIYYRQIGRAHV
jgi:membrane glycosyltransferase